MPKRPPDLRKLASRQRWLVWLVLLSLFAQAAPIVLYSYIGPGPTERFLLTAIFLARVAIMLLIVIGAILIMTVDGTHTAIIVLTSIFLFAPCVNLLILLAISQRATRTLRAAGLKVGLMGVKPEEVDRILNPRLCATCGYDLTGNVSGTCPECGTARPLTPPMVPPLRN